MKTIAYADFARNPDLMDELVQILEEGNLACLPCNGTYRLVADLENTSAVMRLAQSKRRVGKAPSLVFVDGVKTLRRYVSEIPEPLVPLCSLWPAPLTLKMELNEEVPSKVRKQLGKGKVGVRVPNDALMRALCARLGRPLLVSSANRQKKAGAQSPAQVVKSFSTQVDLFVEHGEFRESLSSTVCEADGDNVRIVRPGYISVEAIEEALEAEG